MEVSYTCEGCGRAVTELVNVTPGLVRPRECARCYVKRTGTKKDREAMEEVTRGAGLLPVETLESARAEFAGLVKELAGYSITTTDEMNAFGAMLEEVRTKGKKIREHYDSEREPALRAVENIRNFYKPALDALDAAEKALKSALAAGQARIEEQNRKALAAAQSASSPSEVLAASAAIQPATLPTGVHMRETWSFEIVDESIIPREFLCVDEKKIRAHVAQYHEATRIPGVIVTKKATIVARGA